MCHLVTWLPPADTIGIRVKSMKEFDSTQAAYDFGASLILNDAEEVRIWGLTSTATVTREVSWG